MDDRPLRQHNWHWQPSFKLTQESQMMKSLRRRSWIDAGNSFLIAWMQKSHHSSLGTLVAFRKRLIDQQMDRRLIEQTIELASQSQTFGPRPLRAALESSPLWGAGRERRYLQSGRTCTQKGHARGGRPTGEGVGGSGVRSGGRAGLWEQLESDVGSRLGSTDTER